jgi:putative protease
LRRFWAHNSSVPGQPAPQSLESDFLSPIQRITHLVKNGARNFVLNSPWQTGLFTNTRPLNFVAGPFCNISNVLAVEYLASLGFKGVIVSPELDAESILALPGQSPLPLGIVMYGNWPLCISRTICEGLKTAKSFASPRREEAWTMRYDENYWTYPNWSMDIRDKQEELVRAGYRSLIQIHEPVPKAVKIKERPGTWNWDLRLV